MKSWLQLEELSEFLFSIYLFSRLTYAWWAYPLLFATPDLALLAMAAGPRLGGLVYNLVHHKGLALGLIVLGAWLNVPPLSLAGAILLGHTCLDRVLGYGLKDGETFTHAHLKLITPRIGSERRAV